MNNRECRRIITRDYLERLGYTKQVTDPGNARRVAWFKERYRSILRESHRAWHTQGTGN
jgi:hypothetical protein